MKMGESTAAGIASARAASSDNDLVRKVEFDAALSGLASVAQVQALIASISAINYTNSDTVSFSFTPGTPGTLSAAVVLAANSGLLLTGGLGLNFGTGTNQAARGDHTHEQLHDPLTTLDSGTIAFDATGQQVTGNVIVSASDPGLIANADPDTNVVIVTGAGTAAANDTYTWDGVKYVGAGVVGHAVVTIENISGAWKMVQSGDWLYTGPTPFGPFTVDSIGELPVPTAAYRSQGLRVDWTTVARAVHVHAAVTDSVSGFMTPAMKTKLDGLSTFGFTTENTDTITLTYSGGILSGAVNIGVGLDSDGGGLKIDTSVVALKADAKYTYTAFADEVINGTPSGFSATPTATSKWVAIKVTATALASPVAADFANLWVEIDSRGFVLNEDFVGPVAWTTGNIAGATTFAAENGELSGGKFRFGIYSATSGATSDNAGYVRSSSVLPLISLDTCKWTTFVAFKLSATTNVRLRVGLLGDTASVTPASGYFCRFDTTDGDGGTGKFRFVNRNASSETASASTISADTSWHVLTMRSDGTSVYFSLDGEAEIQISTNRSALGMVPALIIGTTTTVARKASLDWMAFTARGIAR